MSNQFTVTPSNAVSLITRAMKAKRPVFLWGPPGIGKSDLFETIAREQNRPLIDLRLLLMEPTDLKGIPFYCPETNTMRWAAPGELPGSDETELHNAILFLDELTAAPPSVQAAAYQLVLNRRVGTYHLPNGVDIVAAGNRVSDRAVAHRMPSALRNRFVHFTLRHSWDDWKEWAIANRVQPLVVSYLENHRSQLFNFDPASDENAFATPRSWKFVSDLYDHSLGETVNRQLVAGCVGEGIALSFMTHANLKDTMPNPVDVIEGRVTELEPGSNISAVYSLALELCYAMLDLQTEFEDRGEALDEDNEAWTVYSDRFLSFVMSNMEPEMVIMTVVTALRSHKGLFLNSMSETYDEFFNKFYKYLPKNKNSVAK